MNEEHQEPQTSEAVSLEELPAVLGFAESPEQTTIRETLLTTTTPEAVNLDEPLMVYHRLGLENTTYGSSAAIGLHIAEALLNQQLGRFDAYIEEIENAAQLARQQEDSPARRPLDKALADIDAELAEQDPDSYELGDALRQLGQQLGEGAGLDDRTCREVARRPFDEAFEAAYGLLHQIPEKYGVDPDEHIAQFLG